MAPIRLGLKANWKQFILLAIVNGFVGGMVGLERSILPVIAEQEFAIAAKTAILSFIIVFGITKALTNYYSGRLSNKYGRKKLLVAGWIIGFPVPFILMYAPDWGWIIAANILLGIHQGLTWSNTMNMKIDLAGDKHRGMAIGINESAGYVAVAIMAFLTGWIAGEYGLRPYPFMLGIVLVIVGLILSLVFVKDTRSHVALETSGSTLPRLKNIFRETTWSNKNLGTVTQAGLVTNLNDAMAWGVLPILLASRGFQLHEIGIITAIYLAVWGVGQLVTGRMSDVICKKDLMYKGMFLQAISLFLFFWASSFFHYVSLAFLLGWGTAMVYPTFVASIAENTHPMDRAGSIGVFRLWRDLGYAIGGILTGIFADLFTLQASILVTGCLTLFSALLIQYRMKCVRPNTYKLWPWLFRRKDKNAKPLFTNLAIPSHPDK